MNRFLFISVVLGLSVFGALTPANLTLAEDVGQPCLAGNECTDGVCEDPDIGCFCLALENDQGPTCHAKLTAGEVCPPQSPNPCQPGLECTPGDGQVTCEARVEGGGGSDLGGACGGNFDCSAGQCASVGACICRDGTCDVNPDAPAAGAKKEEAPATSTAPTIPRLVNPLGMGMTFQKLIGRVIKAILGISGSLALAIFVWGGFTWLTSGGSSEKIDKGKRMLVWATLGLALIFGAYAVTNFVIETVTGATGT